MAASGVGIRSWGIPSPALRLPGRPDSGFQRFWEFGWIAWFRLALVGWGGAGWRWLGAGWEPAESNHYDELGVSKTILDFSRRLGTDGILGLACGPSGGILGQSGEVARIRGEMLRQVLRLPIHCMLERSGRISGWSGRKAMRGEGYRNSDPIAYPIHISQHTSHVCQVSRSGKSYVQRRGPHRDPPETVHTDKSWRTSVAKRRWILGA